MRSHVLVYLALILTLAACELTPAATASLTATRSETTAVPDSATYRDLGITYDYVVAQIGGRMNAFNARLISAFSSDRFYRVYFDRGEAFFIQISSQSFGQVVAASFGVLGALIYAPIQRKAQAKLAAKLRALDMQPPSMSLAAGKHNFHAMISDFESSALQAPPALRQHGPHLGRWVLQLRGQTPLTLQLETADDMRRAFETLPLAINTHANQVVWDAARNKFVKTV